MRKYFYPLHLSSHLPFLVIPTYRTFRLGITANYYLVHLDPSRTQPVVGAACPAIISRQTAAPKRGCLLPYVCMHGSGGNVAPCHVSNSSSVGRRFSCSLSPNTRSGDFWNKTGAVVKESTHAFFPPPRFGSRLTPNTVLCIYIPESLPAEGRLDTSLPRNQPIFRHPLSSGVSPFDEEDQTRLPIGASRQCRAGFVGEMAGEVDDPRCSPE